MKRKRVQCLIAAACCAITLSGCTKSNIVTPESEAYPKPDFNLYNDIEIDEEQLREEIDDIYLDPDDYPMASAVDFDLNLDEEYVALDIVVKDDTTAEDARWYVSEMIKGFNDLVVDQDLSYGASDVDTFGGLYQDNVIRLRVYTESAYAEDGEPVYQTEIPKDEYMEFDFDME